MREFKPQQLKLYLQQTDPQALLLDVREQWEFEYCHLTGSILMPMSRIRSDYHQLEMHQETVIICHHGIRSRQVAFFLESQGFSNIINLSGGVEAWANEVAPAMRRY